MHGIKNRRVWKGKRPRYCVEKSGTTGNTVYKKLDLKKYHSNMFWNHAVMVEL